MNWNEHRELVKQRLKEKKSISEIASEIDASEYDLKQFIHRNRLFGVNMDSRNLAFKIVKVKFRNPEYFRPTREFFKIVGITQKRWWNLYRGDEEMSELEFQRVSLHLGLTLEDVFEARQLNWIQDLENIKK
ncbi:MAG: hypothetical protein LBV71_08355 [Prevotella sp.]|jgi:hypothetical protein|nr:hypothetical protein [Prevotella sp.]